MGTASSEITYWVALIFAVCGIAYLVIGAAKTIWSESFDDDDGSWAVIDGQDWVFIEYKDAVFPMNPGDKMEWDAMSGRDRRDVYNTMKRLLRKGRIGKHMTEDGKCMYVSTKKGTDFLAKQYSELKKKWGVWTRSAKISVV